MSKSAIKKIWNKIPDHQRRSILADIVTKGGVSVSTAYMWTGGRRVPLPLYQVLIANVFTEHTGNRYAASDLFPES